MAIEILYPPGLTKKQVDPYEIKILGRSEGDKKPCIKIMVENNGRLSIVNFLVDTGCTNSYLSKKDSRRLGFEADRGTLVRVRNVAGMLLNCSWVRCNLWFKGEVPIDDYPAKLLLKCESSVLVSNDELWDESLLGCSEIGQFMELRMKLPEKVELIL